MKNQVDARGMSCPEPVLMAKKALKQDPMGAEIIVDNTIAVENITRLGVNMGYKVTSKEADGEYTVTISK